MHTRRYIRRSSVIPSLPPLHVYKGRKSNADLHTLPVQVDTVSLRSQESPAERAFFPRPASSSAFPVTSETDNAPKVKHHGTHPMFKTLPPLISTDTQDEDIFTNPPAPQYKLADDVEVNKTKNHILSILRSPKCLFFTGAEEAVTFKVSHIHEISALFHDTPASLQALSVLHASNATYKNVQALLDALTSLATLIPAPSSSPTSPLTSASLSTADEARIHIIGDDKRSRSPVHYPSHRSSPHSTLTRAGTVHLEPYGTSRGLSGAHGSSSPSSSLCTQSPSPHASGPSARWSPACSNDFSGTSTSTCTGLCTSCGCAAPTAPHTTLVRYSARNLPIISRISTATNSRAGSMASDTTSRSLAGASLGHSQVFPSPRGNPTAYVPMTHALARAHYNAAMVPNYSKLALASAADSADTATARALTSTHAPGTQHLAAGGAAESGCTTASRGAPKDRGEHMRVLEYLTHPSCALFSAKEHRKHMSRGLTTSKQELEDLFAAGGGNLFDVYTVLDQLHEQQRRYFSMDALVRDVEQAFHKEHERRRAAVLKFLRSRQCKLFTAGEVRTSAFELDQLVAVICHVIRASITAESDYYRRVREYSQALEALKKEQIAVGLGQLSHVSLVGEDDREATRKGANNSSSGQDPRAGARLRDSGDKRVLGGPDSNVALRPSPSTASQLSSMNASSSQQLLSAAQRSASDSKDASRVCMPVFPAPARTADMPFLMLSALQSLQRNGVKVATVQELIEHVRYAATWQRVQKQKEDIAQVQGRKGELARNKIQADRAAAHSHRGPAAHTQAPVSSPDGTTGSSDRDTGSLTKSPVEAMQAVLDFISSPECKFFSHLNEQVVIRRSLLDRMVTAGIILPSGATAKDEPSIHYLLDNSVIASTDGVTGPVTGMGGLRAGTGRKKRVTYSAAISVSCLMYVLQLLNHQGFKFASFDVLCDCVCYYLKFPHPHPHPPLSPLTDDADSGRAPQTLEEYYEQQDRQQQRRDAMGASGRITRPAHGRGRLASAAQERTQSRTGRVVTEEGALIDASALLQTVTIGGAAAIQPGSDEQAEGAPAMNHGAPSSLPVLKSVSAVQGIFISDVSQIYPYFSSGIAVIDSTGAVSTYRGSFADTVRGNSVFAVGGSVQRRLSTFSDSQPDAAASEGNAYQTRPFSSSSHTYSHAAPTPTAQARHSASSRGHTPASSSLLVPDAREQPSRQACGGGKSDLPLSVFERCVTPVPPRSSGDRVYVEEDVHPHSVAGTPRARTDARAERRDRGHAPPPLNTTAPSSSATSPHLSPRAHTPAHSAEATHVIPHDDLGAHSRGDSSTRPPLASQACSSHPPTSLEGRHPYHTRFDRHPQEGSFAQSGYSHPSLGLGVGYARTTSLPLMHSSYPLDAASHVFVLPSPHTAEPEDLRMDAFPPLPYNSTTSNPSSRPQSRPISALGRPVSDRIKLPNTPIAQAFSPRRPITGRNSFRLPAPSSATNGILMARPDASGSFAHSLYRTTATSTTPSGPQFSADGASSQYYASATPTLLPSPAPGQELYLSASMGEQTIADMDPAIQLPPTIPEVSTPAPAMDTLQDRSARLEGTVPSTDTLLPHDILVSVRQTASVDSLMSERVDAHTAAASQEVPMSIPLVDTTIPTLVPVNSSISDHPPHHAESVPVPAAAALASSPATPHVDGADGASIATGPEKTGAHVSPRTQVDAVPADAPLVAAVDASSGPSSPSEPASRQPELSIVASPVHSTQHAPPRSTTPTPTSTTPLDASQTLPAAELVSKDATTGVNFRETSVLHVSQNTASASPAPSTEHLHNPPELAPSMSQKDSSSGGSSDTDDNRVSDVARITSPLRAQVIEPPTFATATLVAIPARVSSSATPAPTRPAPARQAPVKPLAE